MSRDMKPRKAAPAKKSGGGTLVGIFIGLVLGMMAALGVAWYINKAPTPFVNKTQNGAPMAPEGAAAPIPMPGSKQQPGTPAAAAAANAQAPQPPAALPGKPGDPVSDKPRFDFYKILPGNADAVPDSGAAKDGAKEKEKDKEKSKDSKDAKDGKDAAKEAAKETPKETIFLQAGSFQKAGDADNQKASLAMLGVEATVQQVMVGDKVWYRVRLGPYGKIDDVNKVRAELAKAGIDASVVKNKD